MPTYHSLPDLTGYKSKPAKRILKLAEEHGQKMRELGDLGREYEDARQALEDARAKDTEARALAARGGDKDPGRVHEEKARERLEDLQDRLGVMERVVADVEKDLAETITHSKMELLEEARTKRDAANERFTEAKHKMRQTHDEQRHHAGVTRWALAAGAHFSPPPPDMHVLSVPERLPDEDPEAALADPVVSTESASSILRSA